MTTYRSAVELSGQDGNQRRQQVVPHIPSRSLVSNDNISVVSRHTTFGDVKKLITSEFVSQM